MHFSILVTILSTTVLLTTLPLISEVQACDSLAVLPFATADGLGGMYGKNADRHRTEAQPVAAVPRMHHPAGATITLDTGLTLPQVPVTYAHAGSRPNWASPYGGYSEGVNEFGVSIGNEMFPSHTLPTDHGRQPQAEFTDLDRLVLERSRTATEAVTVLTDLITKYGQTCKTCPEAADYNSLFMVADPTSIFSVMAVGHEWAYKQFLKGDSALNGTGVWTISNRFFAGATHTSPTAIATARRVLGYSGSDADFDFGVVYGDARADPTRQIRTSTLLRDLAADHKLTKLDLMRTLSDHSYGRDPHEPRVAMPHWDGTEVDEHTFFGGLSASSMVSDFSADGRRKIAWHTGPNPCMAVYYPIIFHHNGSVSEMTEFLSTSRAWWAFRYSIYNLAGRNANKIKEIQGTWQPIQQQFFSMAESAAERANTMEEAAASSMLRDLLVNITTTIRSTLENWNKTMTEEL